MTGRPWPVTTSTASSGQKAIVLKVIPGEPTEKFTSEFLDGKQLRITGCSDRALLYGVYDFLEKAAGVRWLAPFDYGEIIPYRPNLRFPLFRDEEQPALTHRCLHYCSNQWMADAPDHIWKAADWCVQNRFNVELVRLPRKDNIRKYYDLRGGCIYLPENPGHNFHTLIPPAKYFKEHPDFFCWDQATGSWRAERAQLCTTNPRLVRELGNIAEKYFQRHPDHEYFPLFQEDGSRLWCQCPSCLALNPSGSNLLSATDNNIHLANQVCREIQKKHPDKGVFTYAYGVTLRPPVSVPPIPGVKIMYCYPLPETPCYTPWDLENCQELRRWSSLTQGNMVIYTYHYLNPELSYNDTGTLTRLFRLFHTLGLKGTNQETSENWGGADGYEIYLGARLAWNPWLDEKALRKDYLQNMYHAAERPMTDFLQLLEKSLCSEALKKRQGFNQYICLPENTLKELSKLIEEARFLTRYDIRARKAVLAQENFLTYLQAWSRSVESGDRYYRSPDEKKYKEASSDIRNLKAVQKKFIPQRIIASWGLRISQAWQNQLDKSWKENQITEKLKLKYHILQTVNPWKFRTDPQSEGESAGWFRADFPDSNWKFILSGNFWEDQGYAGYDGAAWYRCSLRLPEKTAGHALYFAGADEKAWVYLDGKLIGGHHQGDIGILWEEPFLISLPDNLPPGQHQLTVKVIDSAGKGGLWKPVLLIRKK